GAMTSSFVFFFSLGYGARALAPLFARPSAWRVLDAIIALTMWAIAVKLLYL
ncbi:MAG: LysE family transporter, partial [Pseudomonadota bacterium]